MVKNYDVDEFQYQILLEAIDIVEANDYVGLLLGRAKIFTQSSALVINCGAALTLYTEILAAVNDLSKYRSLNKKLSNAAQDGAVHLIYDRYFSSRIRSGKLILRKLSDLLPIEQVHPKINLPGSGTTDLSH